MSTTVDFNKVGFNQGVAYAVAFLLREGEDTHAKEIWEASGCTLRGVDDFDAAVIRKAKRRGWTLGWTLA